MKPTTVLVRWTQARLLARAWGVSVERSLAQAVFGETIVVAEYVPRRDVAAPCVVLYEQGLEAICARHAIPRRTVENRAILHELTHHMAVDSPPTVAHHVSEEATRCL